MKTETRQRRWQNHLPQILLSLLILVAVGTVFHEAGNYGIASDEALQNQYGQYGLAWYLSLGHDRRIFSYPTIMHMPEHGVIVEVAVALVQKITGEQWETRAVMGGLIGVAGLIAIALCGLELEGWWLAFVAALSLWLFPRFYGSIYNNSKDIPFLSANLFVLWGVLVLMKQWTRREVLVRNAVLVGFLIGLATSIRITAIIWYGIVVCLFALWWVLRGKETIREKSVGASLARGIGALVIVGTTSFVTMIVLWPWITISPFRNLYETIMTMSKYDWIGFVWFDGHKYLSTQLPIAYIPGWLLVGSPLPIAMSAVVGIIAACGRAVRKRDTVPVVAVLALLVPVAALAVGHATLYDGPRQILFLYGPLVLLGAYGFVQLLLWMKRHKKVIGAIILIALLAQAQVEWDVAALHPYEYMYFSPLVGGVPGAAGKWDMDYYITCNKAAAQWLAIHYQQYSHNARPTIQVAMDVQTVLPYLPSIFSVDSQQPDFYIATTRDGHDRAFTNYKVIATQEVEGYTACVVKVRV